MKNGKFCQFWPQIHEKTPVLREFHQLDDEFFVKIARFSIILAKIHHLIIEISPSVYIPIYRYISTLVQLGSGVSDEIEVLFDMFFKS